MEDKKDRLKQFIQEHKDAFDDKMPPMMDFGSVSKKETPSPAGKMISIKWFYAVAAVFVLIISSIGLSMFFEEKPDMPVVAREELTRPTNDFQLGELSPELAEMEAYYLDQVAEKQAELEKLGLDTTLAKEIEWLDNEFLALKNELGESVDNHLIVNEMIKNYKLKLDLLEQVLSDMQENFDDKHLTQNNEDEKYTTYY